MTIQEIKDRLIIVGVRNLKEYGYESVTEDNILTDSIYSQFFAEMLYSNRSVSASVNKAINELLASMPKHII